MSGLPTDAVHRPDGLDRRLVSPGIADVRGRAFAALLAEALDQTPPDDLREVDWQTCDERLLPFGVRELGLQDLMYSGITVDEVRQFLANADALKAQAGSVRGIRFALALLGLELEWVHWHEMEPPGLPGTYEARINVETELGVGEDTFGRREVAAAEAAIDSQKRWSQEGAFDLIINGEIATTLPARASVGMVAVDWEEMTVERPAGGAA